MLPYYNTCCTKEGCQLVLYVHSSAALRFMNAICLLDPGFDAMDLVTVQWRPNENDYLYFSHRSHWDDTPQLIYSKFAVIPTRPSTGAFSWRVDLFSYPNAYPTTAGKYVCSWITPLPSPPLSKIYCHIPYYTLHNISYL